MTATVLLYSDDARVRESMRLAIGARPAADLTVTFLQASSQGEVIRLVDGGGIDLLVLDGEAAPAGGLGIARQPLPNRRHPDQRLRRRRWTCNWPASAHWRRSTPSAGA